MDRKPRLDKDSKDGASFPELNLVGASRNWTSNLKIALIKKSWIERSRNADRTNDGKESLKNMTNKLNKTTFWN